MLPKTSVYVKRYDGETKWMHFCIEDDELLENITEFGYNISYNKVSNSIKKELDCEPIVELWNLIVEPF